MIPYSRQWVDEEDIEEVVEVLRSDWLTTGPLVERFEKAVAEFVGGGHGVAVSSGTAALHTAMDAAGIGPGDEVIVPAMTFAATANAVVFKGGRPTFADVDGDNLLIDPNKAEALVTSRTKAIVAVDYAGQPCDYDALRLLARRHNIFLIADACHSLGAEYKQERVGTLADLTVFSFHPVKAVTTGEGGMVLTERPEWAVKMRRFRNHGIAQDHLERSQRGTWCYEMTDLGYNYRLTDIQCALGLSQMGKLQDWITRRQEIAKQYDEAFADLCGLRPLKLSPDISHAYHLYVIRFDLARAELDQSIIFSTLRKEGIGVNVHYLPVHLHPFYRKHYGTYPGMCPVSEAAYERILSLPIFPSMNNEDVTEVVMAVRKVMGGCQE